MNKSDEEKAAAIVCTYCKYFDNNSGYCSKIKSNVRLNPKDFIEKCNGKLFEKVEKIDDSLREEDKEEDEEKDKEFIDESISEKDGDIVEEYEFKTLLAYGKFMSGLGWILVTLGIVAFIGGLLSGVDEGFLIAGVGVIIFIIGILVVVFGQLISCFVTIEKNTRITYEILKDKFQ